MGRRDQVVKRRKAVKCQEEEDSKHMTTSKKNENQTPSNVHRSHNRNNSRCTAGGGRRGSDLNQRRLYPGSFMNLYDDFDNDYFFSPFTAQRRRPHDRPAMFGGFW